jgi:hypothetical protein
MEELGQKTVTNTNSESNLFLHFYDAAASYTRYPGRKGMEVNRIKRRS